MPLGFDRELPPSPDAPTSPAPRAVKPDGAPTLSSFEPRPARRRFDQLVVSKAVQEELETALARLTHHRTLYEDWGLREVDPRGANAALNFHGPPGTGKTFCAEAVAHRLNRHLIVVSYAEIESKYVGDTPKNIVAAFEAARQAQAVLFFDEADSILGRRLTNVTQSADHGVNVSRAVMLKQLDDFDGVVVFASNLASNYDDAFVRRILAHIHFELPDVDCRRRLWAQSLPALLPKADDVDAAWLADQSDGLSGGTMLNALIAAASRAVVRAGEARRVERADFLHAIESVRAAQRQVGSGARSRILSDERISLQDASSDLRASRPDAP